MTDDTPGTVSSAEIARLAGVGRAAVSNWRRRHGDFPAPVGGSSTSPSFDLTEVRAWLEREGKVARDEGATVESLWQLLESVRGGMDIADAVAFAGAMTQVAGTVEDPSALSDDDLDARVSGVFEANAGAEITAQLPPVEKYRPMFAALVADETVRSGGGGDFYERFYDRFLVSVSRQFTFTPPDLADLMVDLAGVPDLRDGTVFDPACGAGALLRAARRRAPHVTAYGQERSASLARLARTRLVFTGGSCDIRSGDSLRADAFPGLAADAVLMNPPFNQRDWGAEDLALDPRWEYGLPGRGGSELAWIQHALAHLRPGGSVVTVLPPGVAARRSGRRIRAELLRRGALRAVVALPPGFAPPMGIPLMLWVLRKPVEGEAPPGEVLMVDAAEAAGERLDWAAVRGLVLDAYAAFRSAPAGEGDPGRWRPVPVLDLISGDVDLTPAHHVRQAEHDFSGLARLRATLDGVAERLPGLLPPVQGTSAGPQAVVTVGDLARHGGLEMLRSPASRKSGDESEREPVGGPLALTAADVLSGDAPSRRVPDAAGLVRLRPGDVVVPRVLTRPAARVVTDEDAVAHSTVFVLRPDPDAVDPWFLCGVFSSSEVRRFASGAMRRHAQLDVRRVELLRLPLAEQRAYGAAFERLTRFNRALGSLTRAGEDAWRTMVDGLASGALAPGDEPDC